MPRDVRFTATGSIKIDPSLRPGDQPPAPNVIPWPRHENGDLKVVSVCACGISATFPFCDGAHKQCKSEDPACVYRYDPVTRAVVSKEPLQP
ncbi:MAG: CDGSH iron-sulfur domain-containing protein [Phycisphaerales bacterium]